MTESRHRFMQKVSCHCTQILSTIQIIYCLFFKTTKLSKIKTLYLFVKATISMNLTHPKWLNSICQSPNFFSVSFCLPLSSTFSIFSFLPLLVSGIFVRRDKNLIRNVFRALNLCYDRHTCIVDSV